MIKVIIFDLGKVVLEHSYEDMFELLSKNFEISADQIKDLFSQIKEEWSTGKIDVNFVAKEFSKLIKKPKSVHKIVESWQKEHDVRTKINNQTLRIVDSLRKSYAVILLTNTIDLHYNAVAKTGLYQHFDKIYPSFKLGLRKPDKRIFQYVLKEMKIKPDEAIFIDDKVENTKAAQSLGIKSITFRSTQDLKVQLEKYKVKT